MERQIIRRRVLQRLILMLTPRRTRHRGFSRPRPRSPLDMDMVRLNRPIPTHTALRTRRRRRCGGVHIRRRR
jgi:hypothetical protein